jgi:hypothetical protein
VQGLQVIFIMSSVIVVTLVSDCDCEEIMVYKDTENKDKKSTFCAV